MIKPIETRYAGCRFRSRLEARWARFFDFLAIRWEYEKEGFDLGKNGAYLPDFWLPDLGIWYEIKGELHWIEHDNGSFKFETSREIERMRAFRDQGVACCLSEGLPGENQVWWFGWDLNESSGGASEDRGDWAISIEYRPFIKLDYLSGRIDKEIYTNCLYNNELAWVHWEANKNCSLNRAYEIARSARFEFGESG